jgi:Mrp family chromosome partitioning ATPase
VIDLPAASHSRLGLAVAPYCDGVAMVVEAERTRAPVAEHLLSHLRTVRARVLGAVLNRRRYHLPQRVYRLL